MGCGGVGSGVKAGKGRLPFGSEQVGSQAKTPEALGLGGDAQDWRGWHHGHEGAKVTDRPVAWDARMVDTAWLTGVPMEVGPRMPMGAGACTTRLREDGDWGGTYPPLYANSESGPLGVTS